MGVCRRTFRSIFRKESMSVGSDYVFEEMRRAIDDLESEYKDISKSRLFKSKEYYSERCRVLEKELEKAREELSQFRLKHATLAYEYGILLMEKEKRESVQDNKE